MNDHEQFLKWLNDAYAMEMALIPMLQDHANDAKDNDVVSERITKHVEETREHAQLLRDRIQAIGGDVSAIKSGISTMLGNMNSFMSSIFREDNVKNGISDFAIENYEIAAYTSLRAASEYLADSSTISMCDSILQDEEDMAGFLKENIPTIVKNYLNLNTDAEYK